ncbi:pyrimidine/purine nucleoside phosphorylase [Thiomicrorhabdus sp. 6S3-12]|uniref:pyrimidine/purine nucleoside phosphorylase n=1 Tax=Thiomicrorhabdus sp. 6S3-12 TaxID=2819681 RepID=UPI001AACDCF7|nr:pyrimidine/purine nucleoside phosphorylase [Thiomicrorhabdus sp. 6S3-12]MBO1923527.1 pyrimidine/purine nucleoside phosphorylase [Thiomicrorhabdus sp. 6S3-12]
MSEFNNVTVVREANIYFDGKVTSRKVVFEDGSYKTLGIMMPGDYEFGTEAAEIMEFMAGEVDVLLPGETEWKTIKAGDSFEVPANSKFGIKVKEVSDYCCTYITE